MKKFFSRLMHLSAAFVLAFMLSITGLFPATVHKALADAADPIVASSTGSYVVNPDGTITLSVHGQWQWTTHGSDCNLDRFGVGSAVDWNDASQAGNVIGNVNGTDIDVGAAAGNSRNPADNSVHYLANPAGTINPATGLPYPGTTYCGTYSNPPDYNTGPWGPLSHTYPAGTTSFSACVVTFDIHANEGNGDFPRTPKASHLVATSNNDNSVEANKNTPLGNGCFAVSLPPTLKLVKNVTNDNGGAKTPHDWTLSATGSGGFSDFGDSTTFHTVNAGVGYALSESAVSGYAPGSWSCNGGSFAGSTVTLSAGQNVTCSITNNDIAPTLKLVKTVVNDNGGTKSASDFQAKIDGSNNVAWGVATPVNAGAHTASEVTLPTYTASTWGGDCAADGSITLAPGDVKTCTITNDDIAPSLTLNKIVSNNHGGNATESQWTIKATGTGQSPTNLSGPGAAGGTDVVSGSNFKADTYTLSETGGPNGYAASNWTCTNGVTVTNSQITLANGQTTVCSITNSDIAPTLTVNKLVINPYGPAASPNSFPLFVDGNQVNNGQSNQSTAGNHVITETQQTGYEFTGVSGDCVFQSNMISISLGLAENKSCTITNTAIQPKLIVKKHVINNNSGNKDADDFTMTVSGNSPDKTSFPGDENGTTVLLSEGNYSVDELPDAGYTKSIGQDCTGMISIGQTKTCTITNDDVANPAIHVVKTGPATAHEGDTVTYTFTVTNTGDTDLSGLTVNDNVAGAGIYQSGDANTNGIMEKTETWIYTKQYIIPAGQTANVNNTVTACGMYIQSQVCDTDDHTLDVLHPDIHVVKTGPATAHEGDMVTYTFTVTNTGDTPLSNLTVNDSIAGVGVYQSGDTNSNQKLDLTETWIYTKQYTIPAGQTADVNNTVTACAKDSLWKQVCDTDHHCLDVLHPSIEVVKDGPATAHEGDTVTYTFTVTNTGDVALSNLTVDDDIAGAGTYVSGDTNSNNKLDLTETWIYTKDFVIPAGQTADVHNTVTACGKDSLWLKVCDTDDHTLDVVHPSIQVVKSGPSSASAGTTVTYTFTVTNTGDVVLDGLTVNDNIAGAGIYQSGDTNSNNKLDLTETWVYTKNYTIPAGQTASVNNTVTACGVFEQDFEEQIQSIARIDGGAGEKVCDTDTHTLTIPQVLGATVLVNTGESNTVLITAIATLNALLVLGALGYSRRTN